MNDMRDRPLSFGMRVLLVALMHSGPVGAYAGEVTTTGHRVNLRARPESAAEILGQVEYGERLFVRAREGEWARIQPPEYLDMWVHRDFVEDGRVTVSKLNVRGGPGINHKIVAELNRFESVEVRDEFGDWLRIAPVRDAEVWIHSDYIQAVRPPEPDPPPPVLPVPSVIEPHRPDPPRRDPPPERVEPPPTPRRPPERTIRPPQDLDLVPLEGQGERVEMEGMVSRVGFLFGRPSRYRLVERRRHALETLCFIKGQEEQLDALQGQRVVVSGRRYWVQGVRHPVVVPEEIVRQPQ